MRRLGLRYHWHKLRAIAALLFGRRRLALAIFSRMLVQAPGDVYALASRAHVHAQGGDHDAAIADAQALVAAEPECPASHWFNLAFLLEQADRLVEAEAAFRRALDLDPRLDRAWYGLGLVLIRLQRYDDAVAALERNTELQPMSPFGWYQLARVQFERQAPEETRKIIRRLKGFEPRVARQLERETGLAA